jgi:hypothetical protein
LNCKKQTGDGQGDSGGNCNFNDINIFKGDICSKKEPLELLILELLLRTRFILPPDITAVWHKEILNNILNS